jgi:hypothetical protein
MGTRTLRTTTVALVSVLSLVACSSSGRGKASPNVIRGAGAGVHTPAAAGPTSIKDSKYFGLTTLSDSKLCSILSASEASGILGATASPGKFRNMLGLGIICEWEAGGSKELYVGVSTIADWQGAQAIAQLLKPTATTIDGHPALGADPGAHTTYADLDVAVGAAHDPAIEFRAPTLDAAKSFATTAMPRLIALA